MISLFSAQGTAEDEPLINYYIEAKTAKNNFPRAGWRMFMWPIRFQEQKCHRLMLDIARLIRIIRYLSFLIFSENLALLL